MTASIGLPIIFISLSSMIGTFILLVLVLLAALAEYHVGTCAPPPLVLTIIDLRPLLPYSLSIHQALTSAIKTRIRTKGDAEDAGGATKAIRLPPLTLSFISVAMMTIVLWHDDVIGTLLLSGKETPVDGGNSPHNIHLVIELKLVVTMPFSPPTSRSFGLLCGCLGGYERIGSCHLPKKRRRRRRS